MVVWVLVIEIKWALWDSLLRRSVWDSHDTWMNTFMLQSWECQILTSEIELPDSLNMAMRVSMCHLAVGAYLFEERRESMCEREIDRKREREREERERERKKRMLGPTSLWYRRYVGRFLHAPLRPPLLGRRASVRERERDSEKRVWEKRESNIFIDNSYAIHRHNNETF